MFGRLIGVQSKKSHRSKNKVNSKGNNKISRSSDSKNSELMNLDELQKIIISQDLPPTEVADIIDKQPENVQRKITGMLIEQSRIMVYSGPIPHPDLLREFDQIIPNGADRIMKQAELQSAHRQSLEKELVHSKSRDSLLGIIVGGLITFILIIGALVLLYNGKNIEGLAVIVMSLSTLAGVFVYGKKKDLADLSEKRENEIPGKNNQKKK